MSTNGDPPSAYDSQPTSPTNSTSGEENPESFQAASGQSWSAWKHNVLEDPIDDSEPETNEEEEQQHDRPWDQRFASGTMQAIGDSGMGGALAAGDDPYVNMPGGAAAASSDGEQMM
jgi:hypothetical protein